MDMRVNDTESFIKKSNTVHKNKYMYDLSVYVDAKSKVIIRCRNHGLFEQVANDHSRGRGCYKCHIESIAEKRKKSTLNNKDFVLIQPDEYKLIPLTKGKFAKVDNEDFEYLSSFNWYISANRYARNVKIGLMHRFIMKANSNVIYDHINGDGLDNRKHNLRPCNMNQNSRNRGVSYKKQVKYMGVYYDKKNGKYISKFQKDKKVHYVGYFDSAKEAAVARDEKIKEMNDEFFRLNFKSQN